MAEPLIPYDGASVLNKYFPRVQELQGYLADIMQSPGAGPHEQDLNHHEGFSDFLNTTYVATSDVDHQSKFEHVPPELEMREASFYGDNGKYGGGRPGITNYFVNTVVTAFQAPEWEMLLRRQVSGRGLCCEISISRFMQNWG
ncbi:hypothetical protein CVT26_008149 [Gymnopilus dilepis]|uniref:Uncharacterized protein n=1 Tax=Gymnopilus dilepis TaxID=231916 RepID=A0A409WCM7_9AGAR|nr:hypothetical protein CVT26_008149 [Gymnopilus dilepis]